MLLNASPLNAVAINAAADGAAGPALLQGLLEAQATCSGRPSLDHRLSASITSSGGVGPADLESGAPPLAGLLEATAEARCEPSIGVLAQGHVAVSATASANLVIPKELAAQAQASCDVAASGPLIQKLLAAYVYNNATVGSSRTRMDFALTGDLTAAGGCVGYLSWDNPLQAILEVLGVNASSAVSTTHKYLRAAVSGTALAQAEEVVQGVSLSARLDLEGRVDYAFLDARVPPGRLRALIRAAAYVAADPPRAQTLGATIRAYGFAPSVTLRSGFVVSGQLEAQAHTLRSALSNGRDLDGALTSSALASSVLSLGLALRATQEALAEIKTAELQCSTVHLQSTEARVECEIKDANLSNGVHLLAAKGAEKVEIVSRIEDAELETSEKRLKPESIRVAIEFTPPGPGEDRPQFQPPPDGAPESPIKTLRGALSVGAKVAGRPTGGIMPIAAILLAQAQTSFAGWGTPYDPNKRLQANPASASATISRASLKTSTETLLAHAECAANVRVAELDKWPDVKLLRSSGNAGEAKLSKAYLHSPIHILYEELTATSVEVKAGLGYVIDLDSQAPAQSSVEATPLVEKPLAGELAAAATASGYTVNFGVLEALFNDATATVVASPVVDYRLAAELNTSSQATSGVSLHFRLQAPALALATVNGRLSALYRGVDIESDGVQATADVLVDAVVADVSVDYVDFLKAA